MSAGFLPVSLGMLPGLFVGAVIRRLRRSSALALVPMGEWGTDLAPGDLALWDAAVTVVALLGGLGFAWCVVVVARLRRQRVIHDWPGIVAYVRETEPSLPPDLHDAFVDSIGFDADAPDWHDDWAPWLRDHHARLLERAREFVAADAADEVSA